MWHLWVRLNLYVAPVASKPPWTLMAAEVLYKVALTDRYWPHFVQVDSRNSLLPRNTSRLQSSTISRLPSNYPSHPLTTLYVYFLATTSPPNSPSAFFQQGRATPDVSALGDVEFEVIVGGAPTLVGGTSASAPTFGAIITFLNQVRSHIYHFMWLLISSAIYTDPFPEGQEIPRLPQPVPVQHRRFSSRLVLLLMVHKILTSLTLRCLLRCGIGK